MRSILFLSFDYIMVFISDGNSEMLRTYDGKKHLANKIIFVTALYQIKCLKQIKSQRVFLTCAPISGLPC